MIQIDDDVTRRYFKESVKLDMLCFAGTPLSTNLPPYQPVLSINTDAIALMLGEIRINSCCHCEWRFVAIQNIAQSEGLEIPKVTKGSCDQTKRTFREWGEKYGFID